MLLDGNLEWAPSEDKEEETSSSECHERDPGAASDSDLISSAQLSDARRTIIQCRAACVLCAVRNSPAPRTHSTATGRNTAHVSSVRSSPDDKQLTSGSGDATVRTLNAATRLPVQVSQGNTGTRQVRPRGPGPC